jgi:hypothetical protein
MDRRSALIFAGVAASLLCPKTLSILIPLWANPNHLSKDLFNEYIGGEKCSKE